MEREVAERFQLIETVLLRNTETMERVEVNLLKLSGAVGEMSRTVGELGQSVAQYMEASNARMTRIEQDLGELIRTIRQERGNGQPKG